VMYEIITFLHPTKKHGGALGLLVGDRGAFKKAMRTGEARLMYSPGKALEIRIVYFEDSMANFTVQTRIGI
jgi:hypothetical protein